MRSLLCATVLALCACNLSTQGGTAGLADFTASDCGAVLGGLAGCDLKQPLAQGGRMSVTARLRKDGRLISMRTGDAQVLDLQAQGGGGFTVAGKGAGAAYLVAVDGQDIDQLAVQVAPIGGLAYSELSEGSGVYTPTPGMDTDGTFEVKSGLRSFTLLLAQLDGDGRRMIGRDSFTYELPAGLQLASAEPPTALQFELQRPAPGSYPLSIKARVGTAQARIKIVVKD